MKKQLLYSLIIGMTILASCGGDSEKVDPHHIGSWDLDSYILLNVPSDYSNNEGRILLLNQLLLGGVVIEKYTLNILSDGSYSRKIEIPGPSLNDAGMWSLDDDDFALDSDEDDGDVDWTVEKNEDDQLWFSQSQIFSLIKNSVADTITQDWADSITDEEFNALFDQVTLDLVFAFEKQ